MRARLPVKWIRDRAKAAYVKNTTCYICASADNLELHHYSSMTQMLDKWAVENKLSLVTDEDVLGIRDAFIAAHHQQIYDEVVTLCKLHHSRLHAVYGISPKLSTAQKQVGWVEKQREKFSPRGN